MRQSSWTVVAVVALMSVAGAAQAGVTCKMVASMCPGSDPSPSAKDTPTEHSVPEPASMLLLGAGVSAAGAAVARRRNKNK